MKRFTMLAISAIVATAVACGGGGGGGGGQDQTGQPDVVIGDPGQPDTYQPDGTTPPDGGTTDVYDIGPPPKDPGTTQDPGTNQDEGPTPDEGVKPDSGPPPGCGNGTCGTGENKCNCPQDCGKCDGCCTPKGQCVVGTDHYACGKGGGECGNCIATALACQNQACVPIPLDEGSCKAYFVCAGECPPLPQGQACVQECQAKMSPQGMKDFQNLQNCITQNGCATKPTNKEISQCIEDYCIEPYFRCFHGNLFGSCVALVDCLVSCPADDPSTPKTDERQECLGNCWNEATFDAQMDLQNLINCANKQCKTQCEDPYSEECDACWNKVLGPGGACESFNDKCMQYGSEGCYYLLTCLNGCEEGDDLCQEACVDQTSKNGLALFNAIYDCIKAACQVCKTDPKGKECETCFQSVQKQGGACYNTLQTCLDDRPYGTKKCGEMYQCVNACPDLQCAQECFLSGTKTANNLYDALMDCIAGACPSCATNPPGPDCQTCYNASLQDPAKCKTQFDACQNDQAAQ